MILMAYVALVAIGGDGTNALAVPDKGRLAGANGDVPQPDTAHPVAPTSATTSDTHLNLIGSSN